MTVDMGPAARRMADLIEQVPDDLLDGPTPCPAYTLGDLLDHVSGFALAFTAAGRKETVPGEPGQSVGRRVAPGRRLAPPTPAGAGRRSQKPGATRRRGRA